MTKGTSSFGKRLTKNHISCRRCGRTSYHVQHKECSSCGFPSPRMRKYQWAEKALRRRTTGVGAMKHMRKVNARFQICARAGIKFGTITKKFKASTKTPKAPAAAKA